MQQLTYNTTRQKVYTTRGEELSIKEHNGWRYVNFNGSKFGVSRLRQVNDNVVSDPVFDYIFNGGFKKHPCPAIEYFIYRHRLGNKITTAAYKAKFKVDFKNQCCN